MGKSLKERAQDLREAGWRLRLRGELAFRRAWAKLGSEDGGPDEVIKIAVAVVILVGLLIFGKTIYNFVADKANEMFGLNIKHI